MIQRKVIAVYDYPILMPFRFHGRWYAVADKTIKLAAQQTPFLLRSGKIGPRVEEQAKASTQQQTVQSKKEVKHG